MIRIVRMLVRPSPLKKKNMDALTETVKSFRAQVANHPNEMELEVRIGSWTDRFCPGVSKQVFDQLEQDMLDDPRLTPDKSWVEVVDYHYLNAHGQHIRTRVTTDSERMELKREHTSKEMLEKSLVQVTHGVDDVARIMLSHEVPVHDPPGACVPTHIRIKQRRTFYDSRDDMGHVWCYELSKTWSANSRSAVEHKQHVSEPMYEVECELMDVSGRYISERTDAEVARSFLVKIRSLLGVDAHADLSITREVAPIATSVLGGKHRRTKRARKTTADQSS